VRVITPGDEITYNYLEAPDYVHKPPDVVAGCKVPTKGRGGKPRPILGVDDLLSPEMVAGTVGGGPVGAKAEL
jgi:hypothetical protein